MALTDPTGGTTTTYAYEPFGRTSVDGTSINAFQYTGRENDGTGLYYYRARYYDPVRSRFIGEDPIGLAGGLNQHAYVRGNPVLFRDPLGLISTPEEIANAQFHNSVVSLGVAIVSIPLGVAQFMQAGILTAAMGQERALSETWKALGSLEVSNLGNLVGAATAPMQGVIGVTTGVAVDVGGVAGGLAIGGATTATGILGAMLASGAAGYGIGTLLYSTGYFDALYAWDYYSGALGVGSRQPAAARMGRPKGCR